MLDSAQIAALELTAESLYTEVVNAGVMPFDTGNMQNAQTFVDTSDSANGHVSLVNSAQQARRLYFYPEYNFQTVNNASAGGLWLDSWINGKYAEFCPKAFAAWREVALNGVKRRSDGRLSSQVQQKTSL